MDAKRQSQVLIGVALLIIGLLIGYKAIDQDYQSRQVYETTIQQTTQQQPVVVIVFVTDTGTKYHRDGCQYLNMSKHQIELQQAINRGYTPCSVCHPPNG